MSSGTLVPLRHLRIGLHVQLDLGWMDHPFALSNFRIGTQDELEQLLGLDVEAVRVLTERSDPEALRALNALGVLPGEEGAAVPRRATAMSESPVPPPAGLRAVDAAVPRDDPMLAEERVLARRAEREHAEVARSLRRSLDLVHTQPAAARQECERQVTSLLDKFAGTEDLAIRLLGEASGDRGALHAVNVTVLSLLLGRQLGLLEAEMFDLGVGALLHDVGKVDLPDRVRWLDPRSPDLSVHERRAYEDHVALGARIGRSLGLSARSLKILEQHHECADGSGFPGRLGGAQMGQAASIVALTNRYDQLCNPSVPASALTPHEALALMYAQTQSHFDARVYGAFVKMMGVYPPGSVVQLTDGRHAMVSSSHVARPLRPRLLVHDPSRRQGDTLALDLLEHPQIGIRRSLKPQQLPVAALECLSPRARVCYFFERARQPLSRSGGLSP